MAGILWGLGLALTCVGLVLNWNARVSGVKDLYRPAGRLLLLGVICLSLARACAGGAWLWTLIFLTGAKI